MRDQRIVREIKKVRERRENFWREGKIVREEWENMSEKRIAQEKRVMGEGWELFSRERRKPSLSEKERSALWVKEWKESILYEREKGSENERKRRVSDQRGTNQPSRFKTPE